MRLTSDGQDQSDAPDRCSDAPAQDSISAIRSGRQDHVIQIAVDLFAERGYDNVTVDDIARSAGISRRSLFRHFRQKEEFLGRWMLRFDHQLCSSIVRQRAHLGPLEVFRRSLADVEEIGTAAAERLIKLHRITSESPTANAAMISAERGWEDAVIAAFQRRSGAAACADLSSRITTGIGFVGLRIAMADWVALPSSEATQESLARILDTTFAALARASE